MKSSFLILTVAVLAATVGCIEVNIEAPPAGSNGSFRKSPEESERLKIQAAMTQVSSFGNAADMYKIDHKRYPERIEDLKSGDRSDWYMEEIPVDPWGNEYLLKDGRFSSAGPDGKFGTDDDIS